jgi:hypothetical protein
MLEKAAEVPVGEFEVGMCSPQCPPLLASRSVCQRGKERLLVKEQPREVDMVEEMREVRVGENALIKVLDRCGEDFRPTKSGREARGVMHCGAPV